MPNRFHFSSEEVWRTILSIIMAGYFLEQQGRYIGNTQIKRTSSPHPIPSNPNNSAILTITFTSISGEINTKKIFLNKKGIVKLIPHLQSEGDIDSFRRFAFFKQPALVSPECLQKLRA
jgi:hypothetical protein